MTVEKNPDSARQGETRGRVRYVLIISLALAVLALAVVAFAIG
jgi:hypothetical protein